MFSSWQRFLVGDPARVVGRRETVCCQFCIQFLADAGRCRRVREEHRAEGDGARSGSEELERVAAGGDPAHPDNGQRGRPKARVDGRERDRLERRSRKTAARGAEHRPQVGVELHPTQRVHEGEAVGARRLHRACDLRDVPARRRELCVQRETRRCPAGGDDLGRRFGRLVHVRAGEVQLDRDVLEQCAGLRVLLRGEPSNRDPERHCQLPQPGQSFGQKPLDSGVCEPDRVEHPDVRLRDADGLVAAARERRHRLRDECIERTCGFGRRQRVEAPGGVEQHQAAAWRTGPSTHRRFHSPPISTAQP